LDADHPAKGGLFARRSTIDGDATIVTTRLDTAGMALQEQAMKLHDAIDPLVIGRRPSFRPRHTP